MYSVLSIPLFITASLSIRNFSFRPWDFPSFALDSPLHLDSLALADPLAILPVCTVGILLTQIEIFGTLDGADNSKSRKEEESEAILNSESRCLNMKSARAALQLGSPVDVVFLDT